MNSGLVHEAVVGNGKKNPHKASGISANCDVAVEVPGPYIPPSPPGCDKFEN